MNTRFEKRKYVTAVLASIFAGLFIYFMLSYLLIADRVTIPVSFAISILIFGLIEYYSSLVNDSVKRSTRSPTSINGQIVTTSNINHEKQDRNFARILFVTMFIILVIISYIGNNQASVVFTKWSDIGVTGIIKLASAIMLCFFIPGYGIVMILTKKYKIGPLLSILLAYLFSMLVTGLTAYVSALSFDLAVAGSNYLFITMYLAILVCIIVRFGSNLRIRHNEILMKSYSFSEIGSTIISKLQKYAKNRISELLVFGSLFMIIVVSTYVIFGGITIGDQWYHQGRALLVMSGAIREAVISGEEGSYYPPFQSALLAALTSLSGVPLVNSYASIAFVNAIPMYSFYYFFLSWVPVSMRKAAPIAVSLFTLSSGFGWLYLLTHSTYTILSPQASLSALKSVGFLDIISISNFVIPTAPDFSTGLIYIALPAGFVLLGLIRTKIHRNGYVTICVITAISVLGILAHHEFYLFIIVASLLPSLFKMESKSFVYFSFLLAIIIVFTIDRTMPGNFYTSQEILGYSLLSLTAVFVIAMWIIYFAGGYLLGFLHQRFPSNLKNISYHNADLNFISRVVIVFFVSYLYLLSYVVLSQLPLDITRDHAGQATVPWYQYAMRFGIGGFFAVAFVLSYIFKRFEKEVLVFGVIIIIAFITGPYYSESRFSKYIMIGIVAFASLMIYKILNWRWTYYRISNALLLGTLIPLSGLSVLIFMGYNSLILQTQDYTDTLPRRHFPSASELGLLGTLKHLTNVDSNFNVVSFPNEYDRGQDGFMAKIPSFVGLPYDKIRQDPLSLNASTIDSLYRHLEYSDSRYIIVPKSSIKFQNSITEPTRFAIDYFKRSYEDSNYIILEVPPIHAPSDYPNTDIALVQSDPEPPFSDKLEIWSLPYDNKTFNTRIKNAPIMIPHENQTQAIKLFSPNAGNATSLWSRSVNQKTDINSIESSFRITTDNQNKSSNNHVGLRWIEGDMEYFTKLSKNGLELFYKPGGSKYNMFLSRNTEITEKSNFWYTIRIENVNNLIKIFVNNVPKIQISKPITDNKDEDISKIGLVSLHNTVEFKPIKIWNNLRQSYGSNESVKNHNYYFPLNMLALSDANYDVFRDDDLSIFSKRAIFVSDAPTSDSSTLSRYQDYLHSGGVVVVINSNNNFNGTFSSQFSLQSNSSNLVSFLKIGNESNGNASINVPGMVKPAITIRKSDERIIASYLNNKSQPIAPFAIVKSFPEGGKIILINSGGYFSTISNTPKYFSSLSNIVKLLEIDLGKIHISRNTVTPIPAFIGSIETSGKVTINSSSLTLLDDDNYPGTLKAAFIKIFNQTSILPNISINNPLIKGLKTSGQADIVINSKGKMELPDMISKDSYIGIKLPDDFNLTVILHPVKLSNVQVSMENASFSNSFKVTNGSKIEFHNMRAEDPSKFVTILVKNPQIVVNGNTTIKNANFDGYLDLRGKLVMGEPFNFQGELKAKFDFVDHYKQPYKHGTSTQYIDYLQSVTLNGTTTQHEASIKIPGDISENAKMKGEYVHLDKILATPINVVILSVMIAVTILVILLLRWHSPRLMK